MKEETKDEELTLAAIAKKAVISPAYAGWSIGSAFESTRSKLLGAGVGMLFGAGAIPLALDLYENISSIPTQQTYKTNDVTLTTRERAPVTTPTQILSGINMPVGIGYHVMTREPETTTTIEGSFSGPETTTFTPVFREGQEPLVETRTAKVNYTCSKKDDEWTITLSKNLGSFNEPIKQSLEEHCKDIYAKVKQ